MNKQTEALKLALEALEVATTPLAKDRQEVLRAQAAIREALAEQSAEIPQSITCPFCESQHVPGWLHDYNMDRMKKPAQQEIDELTAQRDKLADILTRTANALKGQPAELSSHSWHDLPEVAQRLKAAQEKNNGHC